MSVLPVTTVNVQVCRLWLPCHLFTT